MDISKIKKQVKEAIASLETSQPESKHLQALDYIRRMNPILERHRVSSLLEKANTELNKLLSLEIDQWTAYTHSDIKKAFARVEKYEKQLRKIK